MEKNLYLDMLQKSLGSPGTLSVESVEGLLGHIADLHNTMGKSYEYLVDVISTLIKASDNKKQTESVQKKNKDLEKEIELLRKKIHDFEDDLRKTREQAFQFELDSRKKEELIISLQKKLDEVNEKRIHSVHTQKDLAFIRSFNTQKDPAPIIEEVSGGGRKKLEDLLTPTPTEEITTLKRKHNELLPPSHQVLDFEEDGEKSCSTTTNKKEDSAGGDDYKFKKVFKKVKRNENNKSAANSAHSTSTPFLSGLTAGGRKSDFTANRTGQVRFDEDDSLENLLGNFIDTKDIKENNNSRSSLTNKIGKKDDGNMSVEKEKAKEKEKEKLKEKEKEKSVPKKENTLNDFLDIGNNNNNNNSKMYKKGVGLAFSQQSPLKSLELSDSDNLLTSIPITRNGRSKAESNSNIMQRMMMGTKKRNSVEPSQTFKLSAKKEEEKKLPMISDEDLVRTSHRSKLEREGLQGFDCDQFL